ncbi:Aste57867_25552 [Aphanomyces stellatus]|uniref:Aste57867_25552 protein n=1 Tax=Aphanomyces stellatus TaxID=120398 RepID=A0A485LTC6_9STRA|nr:hypothetical protein As57867_025473 [Aphanomyces stellatus]VFU02175.1 Aste57867_25552 [Aphanomyces stellatus]
MPTPDASSSSSLDALSSDDAYAPSSVSSDDDIVVLSVMERMLESVVRSAGAQLAPRRSSSMETWNKRRSTNLTPRNAVQVLQAKIADGAASDEMLKTMESVLVVERQCLLSAKSARRQQDYDADVSLHMFDHAEKETHFRLALTRDLVDGLSLRLVRLQKRTEATATFTIDPTFTTISWQFTHLFAMLLAKSTRSTQRFDIASIEHVHVLTNALPVAYHQAFPRLAAQSTSAAADGHDDLVLVQVVYRHAMHNSKTNDILIRCKNAAQQVELAQGLQALRRTSADVNKSRDHAALDWRRGTFNPLST